MRKLKNRDFFSDTEFPFMVVKQNLDTFVPHSHEFFEFFYVTKGSNLHSLDGKEEVVRAGDIVLLSPGKVHSLKGKRDKEFEIVNCIFLPNLLENHNHFVRNMKGFMELLYLEPFNKGYKLLHLSGSTDIKVRIILEELLAEYKNTTKDSASIIKVLLADLLVTIVRYFEQQRIVFPASAKGLTKKAHAILKSIEYIDKNFKEEIKLEDISLKQAGITKEYFCNIFKKITGRTFTEYLNNLRIDYASKLLTSTQKQVSEICYESGFNDLSYFNRVFKAQKGVTPREYREDCP
ncbi:MAG: hypothetical protein A2231_07770 [Candidatus Firestonebacteria bacterium RIFOXYA2_FULL_40_8]|nr:MAG: hypothetical protein A2231_07770 [Candidatus Firestonebacteria bacterium RIFOXYA2_FULL_40_8]